MAENGMRVGPGSSVVAAAVGVVVATGGTVASNGDHENEHSANGDIEKAQPAPAIQKYMQELMTERSRMENHFPLAVKLIDEALERVQLNGRIPTRDQYADVYQQRTIKLSQKVHVPIKDKKFNYVGKLLGPKGNSLRRLQEETQCKIVILGRFSMKDRAREEELRNSADAKYAHLNLPLHVEVSTIAPPAEAYARVAYALAEIRRYLTPDKHDDIRQEQYRELMEDPEAAKKLTLRQLQLQSNVAASSGPPLSGGNSGNGNNRSGGNYRHKFQQQSHYHHNEETVYYRSHTNAYHQPKPYVPPNQRGNAMHTTMQPQTIVRASPPGMVVSAANFNGRNAGLGNAGGGGIMANSIVTTTGGGLGGTVQQTMRYRPAAPYQFVKK
ncbi:KH domain-containing, RNA-binding, signal transduction-associated protein 2 [Drosophila guanche]|uniref:Blast:KH domain-containing, RNA-binding, signal transduction-associated protein 2 n=1 Tax=Drosophila guanche TaxID=7266 RepID=A0A3B0JP09_DROGU|nr:KH domain-containing, RNA-binding, signal transduction-associated protein 2 [Drosophila guanche]SPP75066.1 blast:KH domain-containing%2C RNA-binding%2C signal transduction-associated protein 2 [Drosophila guanche]